MNYRPLPGIRCPGWLLPLLVLPAGEVVAASGAQEASLYSTEYLVQVLGALVLVFGSLFGLLFLLKRMHGVPATDRKDINVIGSLKVGAREKILLVRADEHQLLVGVSAGSIRTLYVYDGEVEQSCNQPGHQEDFSSLLARAEKSP